MIISLTNEAGNEAARLGHEIGSAGYLAVAHKTFHENLARLARGQTNNQHVNGQSADKPRPTVMSNVSSLGVRPSCFQI